MELRHLRWFIAVADELNFHRAAARLHVTQPPLTRAIQALENELGARLLDRSRNHVQLTDLGALFLRDARAIDAAVGEAIGRVRERAGLHGTVRVAAILPEYLDAGPLAAALRAFRSEHPAVAIELEPMLTRKLVNAVAAGRIDLGVAFTPLEGNVDQLAVRVLFHDRPVLALPPSHRGLPPGPVDLGAVSELPLLLFPRKAMPDKYDEILGYFGRSGAKPKRVATLSPSLKEVLEAVGRGEGLSVVPQEAALRHRRLGFVLRPIRGVGGLWNAVLLSRRDLGAPASLLVDALARLRIEG